MLKSLVDRNSNTAILLADILAIIIAGFGSAMVLIVGASIVMVKLNFENKQKQWAYTFRA